MAEAATATVSESETVSDQSTRETALPRGAGHDFVPDQRHGGASRSAQGLCRAPPGWSMKSVLPVSWQAAGAPSAWSQPSQSTHERPRRWCDAGPPGRHSVPAAQKAGRERTVTETTTVSVAVAASVNSGRRQHQSSASVICVSVIAISDQRSAISDQRSMRLLDPVFMITSGSFLRRRVVDGISGVKG